MKLDQLDLSSFPALQRLRVADVMTANPITVQHDSHVSDAVELMDRHHIQHLPVVKDGKLAGLMSERHVRDAMPSILTLKDPAARRKSLQLTRVNQIWVENVETIGPEAPLVAAIRTMRRVHASSLPVVQGGALAGIITAGDLLSVLEAVLARAGG
ncbi:MAG: CBS domain-containing protein [Deltaproteobacteria bacterium]|nr:CBS domain-containing protein [Deltaproteobacteria bacterium]